jgi:hypothetical protein
MKTATRILLLVVFLVQFPRVARAADEVTDWNKIMLESQRLAGNITGVVATRHSAIIQSAVYDAVNGIERRLF